MKNLQPLPSVRNKRVSRHSSDNEVPPFSPSSVENWIARMGAFEQLLERDEAGIVIFDQQGRLSFLNRKYAKLLGLDPTDLKPGVSADSIAHELSHKGWKPDAAAALFNPQAVQASSSFSISSPSGELLRVSHHPASGGGWATRLVKAMKSRARRVLVKELISLQALIDQVPDYLWVKDKDSRFVVANMALAADSGRESSSDMIGLSDFDLHGPGLARKFRGIESEIFRTGDAMIDAEELIVDARGRNKWFSSTKVPLRSNEGQIIGLIGISRDITNRKAAEKLRDGQALLLEKIAAGASLGEVCEQLILLVEAQLEGIFGSIMLLDADGQHLHPGAAPSLEPTYLRSLDQVPIGPNAGSCGAAAYLKRPVIVADIMQDPLWKEIWQTASVHGYRSCWSTPILGKDGGVLGVFAMYSRTAREPDSTATELIAFTTHIASIAIERKLSEDKIHFLAHNDALTGLPNRSLLEDRLTQAISYANRYERWVTVVLVDLDNFKRVNDTLGHKAGDELIKTVADRMSGCVRALDTVIRLGGDEFVIVLFDQPPDTNTISATLDRIRLVVNQPLVLEKRRVSVSASFGVATFPADGSSAETLLACADAAMYHAKSLGRDNLQYYAKELSAKSAEDFELREELHGAIERGEFTLVYQPQVNLVSGEVFGTEALLRWQHPSRGIVPPDSFISLAEETGLIVMIGDWVLREACRQNKAWQDAGLLPRIVCVNVSARQFREEDLIERVKAALEVSQLEPHYLELEITESLVMQDVENAVKTMRELEQLGVRIAIDDFGTGYSSLSALKKFPVSRLKIDKSFVRDLAHDANDQAVVNAIISLGRNLHLDVIAEGVETNEQIAFLYNNNCHEIQGFYFSKPVSASEMEPMLKTGFNRLLQNGSLSCIFGVW